MIERVKLWTLTILHYGKREQDEARGDYERAGRLRIKTYQLSKVAARAEENTRK